MRVFGGGGGLEREEKALRGDGVWRLSSFLPPTTSITKRSGKGSCAEGHPQTNKLGAPPSPPHWFSQQVVVVHLLLPLPSLFIVNRHATVRGIACLPWGGLRQREAVRKPLVEVAEQLAAWEESVREGMQAGLPSVHSAAWGRD
jgi:hypothetical protein